MNRRPSAAMTFISARSSNSATTFGRTSCARNHASSDIHHDLRLRLRALRATVVEAYGNVARFHVLAADLSRRSAAKAGDEHGVNAQFFRVGDLGLDGRGAEI